jgi:predicted nucleotidyltransferase
MNDVHRALEQLRAMSDAELDALCRGHAVRVLTVFGSAISEEPEPRDLDIGVIFEPGADHNVLGLLASLAERLGTDQIDIVDASRASETARMRSIAEGEARYESEPTAYAMAAAAAEALYLETASMREDALRSIDA